MSEAVNTLKASLFDDNVRLRLSAARSILKFGHQFAVQTEELGKAEETLVNVQKAICGGEKQNDA